MPDALGEGEWWVGERGYARRRTGNLGGKFLIGNGALGYRGTLEEHRKEALVACTLAGVYDRRGQAWREPVNAPNGLFFRLYDGKRCLDPDTARPLRHSQGLDMRHGLHRRETLFAVGKRGNRLLLRAERFASRADPRLLCLRVTLKADQDCVLTLRAGVDADVWDINGPHFAGAARASLSRGLLRVDARTHEGVRLRVAEAVEGLPGLGRLRRVDGAFVRERVLRLGAGRECRFTKFAAVATGRAAAALAAADRSCLAALKRGYDASKAATQAAWEALWDRSDVRIEGDPPAQQALRFSIYHLLSIAPRDGGVSSIPARGLSGQVYKGAVFWDTEMFMAPFFNRTQPELARNLVRYRVRTLPGARRKAASLGRRGAFYAWESQESGDEACTLFNITDVLTGRPLRTYFADKQVHISADVAHGVWQYWLASGDFGMLENGGAEVLAECARFFLSWSYFNADKGRYEILDVTGPDEYHERVHNNAYTSGMALRAVRTALEALDLLKRRRPRAHAALLRRLKLAKDLPALRDLSRRLHVPGPDPRSKIIEQFEGYRRLEDVDLKTLKSRLLDPREYLGGGQGLATTTKILKQADVVMLLNVLGESYSTAVQRANWEYYEPRTEHGSSLSACVYALVAAATGKTEWAYRYFMKTAGEDLRGDSKQYVGTLYIGGTHPAANGGAWMAAVIGFGGLGADGPGLRLRPRLPGRWKSLSYRAAHRGRWISVRVGRKDVTVQADAANRGACPVTVGGRTRDLGPGEAWRAPLPKAAV